MKKTSLADIARALGVSKTLVSMVLNNKGDENGINKETQKKVWAKAKELNYKPNMIARGLRMGRSNTLGLIVADISNPFYARICRAVEDKAEAAGYQLIFCSSDEKPEREYKQINMLRDRQVDGLIISTTDKNTEELRNMQAQNFPFVLIDRKVDGMNAPSVTVDNYDGALRMTRHLIEKGYRKIAFLRISPSHLSTIEDRVRGYEDAMKEAGIDEALIQEIPFDNIREATHDAVRKLHEQGAQAIFASNNNIAKAILESVGDLSLRIPEDVALVSFDDIEMFRFVNPPVSAVSQPVSDIGAKAADMLVQMIEGKKASTEQAVLPVDLVLRDSTSVANS